MIPNVGIFKGNHSYPNSRYMQKELRRVLIFAFVVFPTLFVLMVCFDEVKSLVFNNKENKMYKKKQLNRINRAT